MTQEFAGKVVLITGGSRGIGQGISAAFAAQGAQTVLVAASPANLDAAAQAIAATGALTPSVCAADLAHAQQRAGPCSQHHWWCGAHAGCQLLDWRIGQRRHAQLHQRSVRPRQKRRRECEGHPAGLDRDRPRQANL